nr:hypothetical protein [Xanthomonas arboricola]
MTTAHEMIRERVPAAVRINLHIYRQLLDHLIVSGTGSSSMAARGY